jgi:hypothetical protein
VEFFTFLALSFEKTKQINFDEIHSIIFSFVDYIVVKLLKTYCQSKVMKIHPHVFSSKNVSFSYSISGLIHFKKAFVCNMR